MNVGKNIMGKLGRERGINIIFFTILRLYERISSGLWRGEEKDENFGKINKGF